MCGVLPDTIYDSRQHNQNEKLIYDLIGASHVCFGTYISFLEKQCQELGLDIEDLPQDFERNGNRLLVGALQIVLNQNAVTGDEARALTQDAQTCRTECRKF